MADDREQANRLYAASLLTRALGEAFDHRDVAVLACVLPVIEGQIADWLEDLRRHGPSGGNPIDAIRNGQARPALAPPHAPAASLKGNLA